MKDKIREAHLKAGLSQLKLARKLRCMVTTVAYWETGRSHPNAKNRAKLLEVLGLDLSEPESEVRRDEEHR